MVKEWPAPTHVKNLGTGTQASKRAGKSYSSTQGGQREEKNSIFFSFSKLINQPRRIYCHTVFHAC